MEASHIVEILRDAGPQGMHVNAIAKCISSGNVYGGDGVLDSNKLSESVYTIILSR
jgi:glutamine phosphoribosylpyrophosphate amidotransferase